MSAQGRLIVTMVHCLFTLEHHKDNGKLWSAQGQVCLKVAMVKYWSATGCLIVAQGQYCLIVAIIICWSG